ncbi:MAG: hypothetical protein LBP88_08865 [Treponema sp.]|nr:hypothetical protein [Treponema sp.]
MADKQYLASYTVLDALYQNGALKYVAGLQDASAAAGSVGTVDIPRNANVPFSAALPDPVVFSFVYQGQVRVLVGEITSEGGKLSTCVYTLAVPPAPPAEGWAVFADQITLAAKDGGPMVATNPHGLAQVGDYLYLIDYESQFIYILGGNELTNLPVATTHVLAQYPFDVGSEAALPDDAKGQAIIALTDADGNTYLYALYIVNDSSGGDYKPSILVRLSVDTSDGSLKYVDWVEVGLNAQEIVPVSDTNGNVTLLIPAIGGYQNAGKTNGALSEIDSVDPFPLKSLSATVVLTGDATPPNPPTYDFQAIAASFRSNDYGIVYILTGDYDANYDNDWTLYQTTVQKLLSVTKLPISQAVDKGILTQVDASQGTPGYFWDLLWVNGPVPDADRLLFFRGSPLLVNPAAAYTPLPENNPANIYFDRGTDPGQIGGQNVNSATLMEEAALQAAAGVSLKRSVKAVRAAVPAEEEEAKT